MNKPPIFLFLKDLSPPAKNDKEKLRVKNHLDPLASGGNGILRIPRRVTTSFEMYKTQQVTTGLYCLCAKLIVI